MPDEQTIIEALLSPPLRRFVQDAPEECEIYVHRPFIANGELYGRKIHAHPDVPPGRLYAMNPVNNPASIDWGSA